jgi:hypothetical protein
LAPAWQATQPDLLPGLQQESAATGSGSRVVLRRGLVVIQIALSLVIVFGAGLLTRTLRMLATADLRVSAGSRNCIERRSRGSGPFRR